MTNKLFINENEFDRVDVMLILIDSGRFFTLPKVRDLILSETNNKVIKKSTKILINQTY